MATEKTALKGVVNALKALEKCGIKAAALITVFEKDGVAAIMQPAIIGSKQEHLLAIYQGMIDGVNQLEKEIGLDQPDDGLLAEFKADTGMHLELCKHRENRHLITIDLGPTDETEAREWFELVCAFTSADMPKH